MGSGDGVGEVRERAEETGGQAAAAVVAAATANSQDSALLRSSICRQNRTMLPLSLKQMEPQDRYRDGNIVLNNPN